MDLKVIKQVELIFEGHLVIQGNLITGFQCAQHGCGRIDAEFGHLKRKVAIYLKGIIVQDLSLERDGHDAGLAGHLQGTGGGT